jgi:uncharacterized protein (TIGR00255 family)
MTGHGEAHVERDGTAVSVEVRTLNSRYFKLTVRAGERDATLEPRVESMVRKSIRRGTVQVTVRMDRAAAADDYQLNGAVLIGYRNQLEQLFDQLHAPESIRLESLLALPGVISENTRAATTVDADWPHVEQVLNQALRNLDAMRIEEGKAMQTDLVENCGAISRELEAITTRAPLVVEAYRSRLTERVNKILAEYEVRLEPADVIREVGLFAERSDISEELVRLRSHVDQFLSVVQLPQSSGRKLDFLTQEMFREANTIGSKANDAEIARHVVEIKAAIERMREMIQNVE